MNDTTGVHDGAEECSHGVPDVTEIPLSLLETRQDRVLDAAIRRLVDDIVASREITAGFSSIT